MAQKHDLTKIKEEKQIFEEKIKKEEAFLNEQEKNKEEILKKNEIIVNLSNEVGFFFLIF